MKKLFEIKLVKFEMRSYNIASIGEVSFDIFGPGDWTGGIHYILHFHHIFLNYRRGPN